MARPTDALPGESPEAREYYHPYQPYEIQRKFMDAVYDAIEGRKIGIFESPTGTGKSLSLICGSMTWLRTHEDETDADAGAGEPEWVRKAHAEARQQARADRQRALAERDERARAEEARDAARARVGTVVRTKRSKVADPDDEFLVADDAANAPDEQAEHAATVAADVQALLRQLAGGGADDDPDLTEPVKIFFASRTHSQLSQFSQQLKLVKFPTATGDRATARQTPLGARRQLCVHPRVSRLRTAADVNDRCSELVTAGECSFHVNPRDAADRVRARAFRDRALADVRDIEDLAEVGRATGVCPYYGARDTVPPAEIVTLPYPLLLQPAARRVLGISLKDQIVIIDEAHNLLDTLTGLFSISVSLQDISRSRRAVDVYLAKFSRRLNGGNRVHVAQIAKLLAVLENALTTLDQPSGAELAHADLLQAGAADTINVYKLEAYLERSRLARKVERYAEHVAATPGESAAVDKPPSTDDPDGIPTLSRILAFLLTLMNPSAEGKVFYERTKEGERRLRYMLLDASYHFRSVVEDARAVILAGGTMSPVQDYLDFLFPYVPHEQISLLSCDHVIPRANLDAWVLGRGPTGLEFSFTFDRRAADAQIDELGRALVNLVAVVPKGVVVFFPSYAYADMVAKVWQRTAPGGASLWAQIERRKRIFAEPRTGSVDAVLAAYAAEVAASPGALLMAVVGGKMSEGINFADDLARAVVMVGLPFPNARSAEMVVRRRYVEQTVRDRELAAGADAAAAARTAAAAAQDNYENLCMRAVNQSIGRGIRHANDYAVIVFVDVRYAQERIRDKLPAWIRSRMAPTPPLPTADVLRSARAFFAGRSAPAGSAVSPASAKVAARPARPPALSPRPVSNRAVPVPRAIAQARP
ncbi:helicase C-terminal domain-containing protein [Dipodascopsis tothii]|uniref:helicase C-terminal domain-containing protein n=1 Tax=Dipodascopsis tothii TaxID=44089 RepID=UPI0034CDE5DE